MLKLVRAAAAVATVLLVRAVPDDSEVRILRGLLAAIERRVRPGG